MRYRSLAVFASAASAVSSLASGQQLGTRLPGSSGAMVSSYGYPDNDAIGARPSDEAVKVVRGLARCVAARKPVDVKAYLIGRDETSRQASYARFAKLMPTCLSGTDLNAVQLQVSGSSFAGALSEALLVREPFPTLVAREPSKTEIPYWLSNNSNQRVVQEMAICLSDRLPVQSSALIRSAAGSKDEQTAFDALVPSMGPCLVAGSSLRANRSGIRLALAGAMYHRITDSAEKK